MTRVRVAVGVVLNAHHQILVAKRLPNQHQGECWEFPGGKIEPGETEGEALKRELLEEVGIEVLAHEKWLEIDHDYTDKKVSLLVHKVTDFLGEPWGCLGQTVQWVSAQHLSQLKLPHANQAILTALLETNSAV